MFSMILREIHAVQRKDPALRHPLEALWCYPGMQALRLHRRAHRQYLKGHFFRARVISRRACRKTGIDIHPGATIGKDVFIDHGLGLVIGETAVVEDHVTLYHGVTLGATGKSLAPGARRHPTVCHHAMIGAHAQILGNITIGCHARIGAGAVVLCDVPPYATCVGNPGRIIQPSYQPFHTGGIPYADLQQPDS
ncbi:MAG: serine acetyltransferase [Clostridiales bacterium]|nr:serine acetyltransferase [Clostridiales bacterium]